MLFISKIDVENRHLLKRGIGAHNTVASKGDRSGGPRDDAFYVGNNDNDDKGSDNDSDGEGRDQAKKACDHRGIWASPGGFQIRPLTTVCRQTESVEEQEEESFMIRMRSRNT